MTSNIPEVFTNPSRVQDFRFDLLDQDDQVLGTIDGVTGGSLTWSAGSAVKVGGQIDVTDVDGIDWLTARVQIWRRVGDVEWSRGIYIPSAPQERWRMGRRSWQVDLLGKLSLVEKDEIPGWLTIPAGVNIVDTVLDLLGNAGHTRTRIPATSSELRTSLTYEAGTKLLTIINELLGAAGYWGLTADPDGAFASDPYVRPASRPIRYTLTDTNGIYLDDFTRDRDVYSIPNRVVLVSQSTAEDPPLVGVAENTDPDNPFSIPARGQVIVHQETGLEVADQSVIDELARKKLIERSSVTASLSIQHAPLPLDLNDAVEFRRTAAGIDQAHTVQGITEPLDHLALMTTTLREVVDL